MESDLHKHDSDFVDSEEDENEQLDFNDEKSCISHISYLTKMSGLTQKTIQGV